MAQPGYDGRDEGAGSPGAGPSHHQGGEVVGSAADPVVPTGPATGPWGYDAEPPGGFPREGYKRNAHDPLPPGYGWAPPSASLPPGWSVDPQSRQILPPGTRPSGQPPEGLLPGYSWIGPGSPLPEGWHVDPDTNVLVEPQDLGRGPSAGRSFGPSEHGDPAAPGRAGTEPTPWSQASEPSGYDSI